jgi:parallel beta-helix repeat protein
MMGTVKNDMKKILVTVSLILAFDLAWAANVAVDCDSGQAIQSAVDNAKSGDLILVNGTCRENVSIPSHILQITLDGQGRASIQAPPKGDVMFVRGREITIQGFTLSGGGRDGIHISGAAAGASANILGNTIRKTGRHGIHLDHGSVGRIGRNIIEDIPGIGIEISESSVARIGWLIFTLEPNTIRNVGQHGILITRGSTARILGNTITGNKRNGILVDRNSQADIFGNTVSANGEHAVAVMHGSGVNLGREGNPPFKMSDNLTESAAKNQGVGIACAVGGYVSGPRGTLDGIRGEKNIDAGCVDRVL